MDSSLSEFHLMRFWPDDYPATERLAAWREVLSRMLLKVDVEQLSEEPFQVDASLRMLPGLRFGMGSFSPSISRHTREMAAADNDDFYLMVNTEGALTIQLSETEATLAGGDACLLSCSQEASLIRRTAGRVLCARFERAPLAALVPDIDGRRGHVVRRGNEALRLFTTYLRDLDDNQALATQDLRKLVVAHVYDLLALVLNSSRDTAQMNLSAARLRGTKTFIADNLHKQNLTIADVAVANRLSPRQVQRLFEAEGTTFSEFLLAERLQRVHAALTDSRQSHRSVSDIVLSSGFGDVSYFNRAFRRQYTASPSAVRQSAAASHPLPARN